MDCYSETVDALMREKQLDCFLSFTSDCHLNEYIGPEDQRVRALTRFTGSNGIAVTCAEPVLITDSRYYIQAKNQSEYPLHIGTATDYIISKGYKRVGFDTRLVSYDRYVKMAEKFEEAGIELVETLGPRSSRKVRGNLVYMEDIILADFLNFNKNDDTSAGSGKLNSVILRLVNRLGLADVQTAVTGSSYRDKLRKSQEIAGDSVIIISELDTIAWLLNIRGSDIEYNPVFYSYMAISSESIILFTDHQIEVAGVERRGYNEFEQFIDEIREESVLISGGCSQYIYSKFSKVSTTQTIREAQATKNIVELAGMALAQLYDGVAMVNLFGYMEMHSGYTEQDVANKLEEYRRELPGYMGQSFETISAGGVHSAIVHHSSTDALIDKSQPFLIDAGSHFYFGTTDTSRTLFLGASRHSDTSTANFTNGHTSEDSGHYSHSDFIHDYTLVLKGHMLAMIKKYNESDAYSLIDETARVYLKQENKDFGHATGHGVGHFLCVHEHPPTVSPSSTAQLVPWAVFSIEPGYYLEDRYGIRIESLAYSQKQLTGGTEAGGLHSTIAVRNITIVPYQLDIIEEPLLTDEERAFLNGHSEDCLRLLKDFVNQDGLSWLNNNCKRL